MLAPTPNHQDDDTISEIDPDIDTDIADITDLDLDELVHAAYGTCTVVLDMPEPDFENTPDTQNTPMHGTATTACAVNDTPKTPASADARTPTCKLLWTAATV